eukprot:SAG31_NODE_1193_length_9454_cov_38.779156_12_plen_116_part_00
MARQELHDTDAEVPWKFHQKKIMDCVLHTHPTLATQMESTLVGNKRLDDWDETTFRDQLIALGNVVVKPTTTKRNHSMAFADKLPPELKEEFLQYHAGPKTTKKNWKGGGKGKGG